MTHARESRATILSLVAVDAACFVVAKASWPLLLVAIVVASFGLCLYKLIENDIINKIDNDVLAKSKTWN